MAQAQAVIVLAAGRGTRMRSRTPKVLHELCGRTLLAHALAAAAGAQARRVAVVVRHERERVAAEARRVLPGVVVADQDAIPGTGRAVACGLARLARAGGAVRGTVLVTSGDVPLLRGETLRALAAQRARMGNAVQVLTTVRPDPTGYGRIVRRAGAGGPRAAGAASSNAPVVAIVEERDATPEQRRIHEVNAGVYAFDGAFLARALDELGTDNDQREVYLTDTVGAAVALGRSVGATPVDDPWQAAGCNDRIELAALAAELNRRVQRRLMAGGVTIVDPVTTWIEPGVRIGADSVIEPGTVLRGDTRIGSGCRIGPHTVLERCAVGEGSRLPCCWGSGARIGAASIVEPFTRLAGSSASVPARGSDGEDAAS